MSGNVIYDRRDSTKTAILDCENIDNTRQSVADIFNVPLEDLRTYLRDFKLADTEPYDILFESILRYFDCRWGYSETAWIHMCRCLPTCTFDEGLLPLPEVLEDIWAFLYKLAHPSVTPSAWKDFRKSVEDDHLYTCRIGRSIQYGPYGVLIGDLSFNARVGQNHYLTQAPEIVTLIGMKYIKKFNHSILASYREITKPCVVKFKTDTSKFKHLLAALSYVYELEQPVPSIWINHSDCHCGEGAAVLPHQILKVSFLNDEDLHQNGLPSVS